ncbi:hypothetical protein MCOR25_005562 [Pyricularia grisea]|nr:hypothetical protein MCOR25_005562 [Pyricularia grisea]
MTSSFHIKEHVIEAQHIREYPRATANSQEEVLQIAVKQYIPKNNPNPQPGDVTIIGAHANGFPKELYEALWEDMLTKSTAHGFKIRSIWITDVAWQGQSGILNEGKLGNDPSWADAERDLLHMINHFRDSMPRPLVGIGHSFGGAIITGLSLLHPRLLQTVVLLDPVIAVYSSASGAIMPMTLSSLRRDVWPSRAAAAASFAKSPFYRAWDPRVLDAWVKHGLRDCPTLLYPDAPAGSVTLATTKHQECFCYFRPKAQRLAEDGTTLVMDETRLRDLPLERRGDADQGPFYQPGSARIYAMLPHVAPSVLYVFGGTSDVNTPEQCRDKLARTGVGLGGSGGVAAGRVAQYVIEDVGHLVAMDKPDVCAEQAAAWIGPEIERWRREELKELEPWWRKPGPEKWTMNEQLLSLIPKPGKPKL